MMKKIYLLLIFYFAFFLEGMASKLTLDSVHIQLIEKGWVNTKTATLRVSVNATMNHIDLIKAKNDILDRLQKIAQGDWHLTDFSRQQDSSGLDKLTVNAENRVSQDKLNSVYQTAKSVSYPGATYTVTDIDFTPSVDDVEPVRTALRQTLYQRITKEITLLNQQYPLQHYAIHGVVFLEGDAGMIPMQQDKLFQRNRVMATALLQQAATPPMVQSKEIVMRAQVTLSSNRLKVNQNDKH